MVFMKEILNDIEQWFTQGHAVALATVVNTVGSSPRERGAVMAVSEAGEVTGSLSGGCVEAAVVEEALGAIAQGQPRLLTYGVADELGLQVGLTCGGTIQVFVESLELASAQKNLPLPVIFDAIRKASEQSIALCTVVAGKCVGAKMIVTDKNQRFGFLGSQDLDQVVALEAQGFLSQGLRDIRYYGINGECYQTDLAVFIHSFARLPHLIIFGAVDFTRSLCKLAKMLGYRVTICDARSSLNTPKRFPEADEIVVDWPSNYLQTTTVDSHTSIAVLTHDPKFDLPILVNAVRTPAAYIGAMGSRKATAERIERLKEAGLSTAEINRITAPIGLDIGAITPDETAVSIMAEIIAQRSGRSGGRLNANQNLIHPRISQFNQQQEVISLC
ncbi:XdhC family protein [Nostoc sp. NZL]|uniref:XdhC family protein n=1 Tax=Nostoc sp. NZL TaxID=2650612 RepID=UPI0018C67808|nr:XdhC/CoxI family protein [Nostoc sp. NZL]